MTSIQDAIVKGPNLYIKAKSWDGVEVMDNPFNLDSYLINENTQRVELYESFSDEGFADDRLVRSYVKTERKGGFSVTSNYNPWARFIQ